MTECNARMPQMQEMGDVVPTYDEQSAADGFKSLADNGAEGAPSFPQFELMKPRRTACCCIVCTCCFCPEKGSADEYGRDWVWAPFPYPCRAATKGIFCCCACGCLERCCWCEHKKKTLCRGKETTTCCDCEPADCDECCMKQCAYMFCCCCDASNQCNCTKPKQIAIKQQCLCLAFFCSIPCDDDVRGEIGCCGKMCRDKSAEPSTKKVVEAYNK